MRGKVYLVGAGPGDPELLTLKALRLLEKAQVVLYDRLVGKGILECINPAAELAYVGKELGEQEAVQNKILESLVEYAQVFTTVVRLKGGDPFVFGRGAEEWSYLRQRGIAVEVVPGISSALSVPALEGVPLTYRGVSGGFAVVTGNRKSLAQDWSRYAQAETLVVLMGVAQRVQIAQELIRLGRDPGEAAAFIERGSTPQQRTVVCRLGEVAAGKVEAESPAVWVIGPVVEVRQELLDYVQAVPAGFWALESLGN